MLTFDTERLILKPTTESDAALIFELFNTPSWLRFIGDRNIHSIDAARQYINTHMLPQLKRLGYSSYTIVRKVDGEQLGTCGLYDRNGLEGIDIGFALLPGCERQGYGFEAASRVLLAAFKVFDLNEVNAITTKQNFASQKLLEKLGLRFADYIVMGDEELMLYQIKG